MVFRFHHSFSDKMKKLISQYDLKTLDYTIERVKVICFEYLYVSYKKQIMAASCIFLLELSKIRNISLSLVLSIYRELHR